jgi:hypothetical protein
MFGASRVMDHVRTLIAVAVLMAGVGCSATRHVNLLYGPNAAVAPEISAATSAPRVAVALFTDARDPDEASGRFLGSVRTIYGRPSTGVYAMQDPVVWVAEGITRGLATRGYAVERVTSSWTAGDLPTITGKVTRVSSGMYMNVEAHVEADLALEQAGRQHATVHCAGETLRSAGAASSSLYEDVFLEAMTRFLDDCVPKLETMITRGGR